jgi:predicted transcriptional regulator
MIRATYAAADLSKLNHLQEDDVLVHTNQLCQGVLEKTVWQAVIDIFPVVCNRYRSIGNITRYKVISYLRFFILIDN